MAIDANAPCVVLLGAGASKQAGVPTSVDLLDELFTFLKDRQRTALAALIVPALNSALGGLRFARPHAVIDIEDLYQMLRQLSQRHRHPLSPFIGAWHESVSRAERIRDDDEADFIVQALAEDISHYISQTERRGRLGSVSGHDLGRFREALRGALATARGDGVDTFEAAATHVLTFLFERCWIPTDQGARVTYLHEAIRSAQRRPLKIATLNYDNSVELAARAVGVAPDIGIRSGFRNVRFEPSVPLSLAKVHGSLDWTLAPSGQIEINEVTTGVRRMPTLIFGSGNKLRITGPYLDLLFAFRSWLDDSKALSVCGYSFRDVHINYLIYSWLEADTARKVYVSDPSLGPEELAANFDSTMDQAMSELSPLHRPGSVNVVARWYQERFVITAQQAEAWAAMLANSA